MSVHPVSPFAPQAFPALPPIEGFDMATAEAGIKYAGRTDVWVLRGAPGTQIAGVYTRNKAPGSPIVWSRAALDHYVQPDIPRLVIVNSGTANVFCGVAGDEAVRQTAQGVAEVFETDAQSVQIASTGVIGQPLKAEKILACLPPMKERMTADGWEAAARAILTTDTFPKGATLTAKIGDVDVTLNGIAKGSGMIAPNMGTMLAYIATDAAIDQGVLQGLLERHVATTFNAITVDGDTSTSDTLLLAASRTAKHPRIIDIDDPALADFEDKLHALMLDLAHQIIKDGEGASKFVTVKVQGATDDESARGIAMSIANSPLVKTAIAGEDANWGRIVMAVGKSGEPADRDKLSIWIGPHLLAEKGVPAAGYTEADGAKYMKQAKIDVSVDVGLGTGTFTAWTCDLTHRYIDINADYRS